MTTTLIVSDSCANELRAALAAADMPPTPTPTPVPTPTPTPVTPTPPPVVPAPAGGKTLHMAFPPWVIGAAPHVHIYTANAGGFGPNDICVIALTTPAQLKQDAFGNISWSDIGADPPWQRTLCLSETAGDFSGGLALVANSNNASLYFTAGPNAYGYPALTKPNTTYYLNVKNNPGAPPSVNLDFEFTIPS